MEIIEKTTFDRLYALQVATVVAREGTFAKAAKVLGTSASNITKEIQKLESYLGVILFKRTTRSFVLTEEGHLTLERSKNLLEELNNLEEQLHGVVDSVKGVIRITAPTTIGQSFLAPIFAEFQLHYPYVEIDLILTDRVLDPVEHNIDLSIRTAFQLKDSSLYMKRVTQIDRVICASPRYIDHFKRPTNLESLSKHNCLLYLRGDSPFIWSFKKGQKISHIQVQGSYKSNNLMSLIKACELGVGILNVPRYLVDEQIQSGELVELFKSWELPSHSLFFLTSRRPSSSKKLEVLEEFLSERLT
ncbi:LysR family transcriptional regulator [Halobacteriovorax sp. HFRX-2_2]|uniref:LysR family transcriptional regulator n=1 Tax=unclassified Halobacteriovorax TaxID=2639665 RepID=UPI00371E9415